MTDRQSILDVLNNANLIISGYSSPARVMRSLMP
jgi:hypothetical protein